jgi:DNA polymerase III alpha subunit (gram-positive type)
VGRVFIRDDDFEIVVVPDKPRPRYPYICDTCGKWGVPDDGISGVGDDCPDEECPGTIQNNNEEDKQGP